MTPAHRITGTDDAYCVQHGKRVRVGTPCPLCRATPGPSARAMPVGVGKSITPKVKRPNAGAMDEIAMRAILNDLGYVAIEDALPQTPARVVYVAEFTFAPHERRWRCDFCLVVKRLAIEIDGGSHAAVRVRQSQDTEKRGELAARGYRVVTVTPEEVRDGTARDRLVRALEVSK